MSKFQLIPSTIQALMMMVILNESCFLPLSLMHKHAFISCANRKQLRTFSPFFLGTTLLLSLSSLLPTITMLMCSRPICSHMHISTGTYVKCLYKQTVLFASCSKVKHRTMYGITGMNIQVHDFLTDV